MLYKRFAGIFRDKKEIYKIHINGIKKLGEMGLNVNILNSKFYIQKVKFLRLIITLYGIKINLKKVKQIKN